MSDGRWADESERLRNIVRTSIGSLSAIADQLDEWAQESRTGGRSTHQVDPMTRKADELETTSRSNAISYQGRGTLINALHNQTRIS